MELKSQDDIEFGIDIIGDNGSGKPSWLFERIEGESTKLLFL